MRKTRSGPLKNVYKLIFNNYNIIKYQFGAGVAGVAESQESTFTTLPDLLSYTRGNPEWELGKNLNFPALFLS